MISRPQFINAAAGKYVTRVDDYGLRSCTNDIQSIPVSDSRGNNGRVELVDTPGFDHTSIKDTVILKNVANWLQNMSVIPLHAQTAATNILIDMTTRDHFEASYIYGT